jgi:Zn finger protein HypA/HybF involved in hydrogenase expression
MSWRNINFDSQYQLQLLASNIKNSSAQLSLQEISYAAPIVKRKSLIQNQIAFLLCKSCYWCMSLLDLHVQIELCPVCKGANLVRMPIL